jgi:pimeloyl-ACP methyl ester carboxylesterase
MGSRQAHSSSLSCRVTFLLLLAFWVSPTLAHAQTLPAPTLENPHACPEEPGFTCATLRVPLDHSGAFPGTLALSVATADNVDKPVLLLLTGGPGQPGVSLVERAKVYLEPEILDAYRLVMLDQRGTGAGAIDCRELQEAVGGRCGVLRGVSRPYPRLLRHARYCCRPRASPSSPRRPSVGAERYLLRDFYRRALRPCTP